MNTPEDLKYTSEHEWIKFESQNLAVVGITDFAQGELGDIVYIEIDGLGKELEKGAIFGTVEAVKTTSELYMPLSGKVVEFNPELDEKHGDNPALINEEPYDRGWIVKIELTNPSEIADLMDSSTYSSSIS